MLRWQNTRQLFERPGSRKYSAAIIMNLYLLLISLEDINLDDHSVIDAGSIYLTFETLKEVYRPGEETGWRNFYSSSASHGKRETSFGFRDGWPC